MGTVAAMRDGNLRLICDQSDLKDTKVASEHSWDLS